MTHRKGAIWTERVLLALIVGSLIGSLNLIIALNRRSASHPSSRDDSAATIAETASTAVPTNAEPIPSPPKGEGPVASPIVPEPSEPDLAPPAAPVDPTTKIVDSLTAASAREDEASRRADARAEALERARQAAIAESRQWKRRELLGRQQVASLNKRADELETSANILDAERDVLAHERDALKAALSKAGRRSGFAVLPYKGPNGTWRRPIVIECSNGIVTLQPQGLKFTTMELSPFIHPRSSPFVRAIAQQLLHIQAADSPDGAPVVPYLVFLVRPDGIRPYYEARSRLEPLGIAFGYELIEQDLAVDIPDFDDLTTWDGSVPLDMPLERAPKPKSSVAMLSTASPETSGTSTGPSGWPGGANSPGRQRGTGSTNSEESTPADFVWPSRPRQSDEQKLPGGSRGVESFGDPSQGELYGQSGTKLGDGRPGGLGDGGASSSSFAGQPLAPSRPTGLGDPGGRADVGQSANAPGTTPSSGDGSGTMTSTAGGRSGYGQGQQPGGSGSGLSGAGGLGSLPDLEPAGDSNGSAPARPQGGSSPFQPTSAGTGRGGQSSGFDAGRAGGGFASAAGRSSLGESTPAGAGGGRLFDQGSDQAGGGASSIGGGSSQGQSTAAGSGDGQFLSPGGGQAAGGTASTGGSGSSASNAGAGGQELGFAPYQSSPGGPQGSVRGSGPGSGSNTSAGVGAGPTAAPDQSSGGAAPSTESGNATVPIASDLPAPPQAPGGGAPAADQQPGAGPDTVSGSLSSSNTINLPPQGSNVSGSPTGSSSGTASASGLGSNTGSSSSGSPSSTGSPSPSASTSISAGMPMGSTPSSGTPSSPGSTLSFVRDFGSPSDSSKQATPPPPPKPALTMGSIEVPFEIIVVCRRGDVLLHPGGYRLTTQTMKEQAGGKDSLLALEIRSLVRRRAQVDPMIRPRPKLTFLVESNGSETFWTARRQLLFALPDWPMSLQIAESQGIHVFNKETW